MLHHPQDMLAFAQTKSAAGRYESTYYRKADISLGRRFVRGRGFQGLSRRVLSRACPDNVRDWDIDAQPKSARSPRPARSWGL
eukprot:6491277-Amphidinium_carterae.1